jgi:hypothetical protein
MEEPLQMRSRTSSALPVIARPTRQVRPTTLPERLRIALMRCSVASMPARLSPPKSPTWAGGEGGGCWVKVRVEVRWSVGGRQPP